MKKFSLISATVLSSVAFMTAPVATVFANDGTTSAVTSEAVEHFVLTVVVNDKVEQVAEYDVTYTNFLSHLSATSEAKVVEGLTAGEVVYDGNNVTLKFTGERKVEAPKTDEAPKTETKEVKKEDFLVVLNVDGKLVQESKFDQITYDEFLPHLTALIEAQISSGLKHDTINYDGNKVTVGFSTVKKDEVKTETPKSETKPTETKKTETKPTETKKEDTTKKSETKSLPKTGDVSLVSTIIGSLTGITGLVGLSIKKRK